MIKRKWFLYLTEFFSGMSVMAIEIGASRLLAPYFSSSQIVWTIIIGTIMIAMALGNLWGGRVADKDPSPARLYVRLTVAAVWIGAIPLVGKYIIALIAMLTGLFVQSNYLIWSAFIACFVIFVFPLMLLGTTSPALVKYAMDNLEDAGGTVGRMNALNTIGSIIGTFAPTFITIPAVGTAWTFVIFAVVLMLLSLGYFLSVKRKRIRMLVCLVLIVVMGVLSTVSGFAFWTSDTVYEGESVYNYLRVYDDEHATYFSTNVLYGVQSVKTKHEGLTGLYYDTALIAPYMTDKVASGDEALEVLILGMGTGTYGELCMRYLDGATVEGVEIDRSIIDIAYDYFDMSRDIKVTVEDGRAYLTYFTDKKYDVILVDAYQDVTIPFQMSSVEFFTLVREHLTEGGVMTVNLNMNSDAPGAINKYLTDTISAVFDHVYSIPCYTDTTGNRIVYASVHDRMESNLAMSLPNIEDPSLSYRASAVQSGMTPVEAGDLILTDDRAPVELLGMRVIDEIILDSIAEVRQVYREGGLKGLFDYLIS